MKELLSAILKQDEDGNLSIDFQLDEVPDIAARVDTLLSALMHARENMPSPVSTWLPAPGQLHTAIFGSNWHFDPTLEGDGVLRLHHPVLGWLSWHIPQAMGRELAEGIVKVLDAANRPSQVQ